MVPDQYVEVEREGPLRKYKERMDTAHRPHTANRGTRPASYQRSGKGLDEERNERKKIKHSKHEETSLQYTLSDAKTSIISTQGRR